MIIFVGSGKILSLDRYKELSVRLTLRKGFIRAMTVANRFNFDTCHNVHISKKHTVQVL